MHSLEQVIYFLDQRQQTEDWNIRDEAIAYLKGYQEILPEYVQMKLKAAENEPLTWEQLRQMEGKPVYWTHDLVGEWLTIYCVPTLGYGNDDVIYATTCSGDECCICTEDMDKYKYYRKEKQ